MLRAGLTYTLPLTRLAASDIQIELLWRVGRLGEAACQAASMRPLSTSHYKQQITAQIVATDRDGEGLSYCTVVGGGGKSRPERRLTVTPFQPAIAIRVPAQTACCDLVLFVPGMRPCQSDVCCLAGQRLDVLELREVLLAANVPRISTVSSSCCASEAAKTTES